MTLPASAQHFADPVAASAFAAYRQAQIEEYGQYVATDQIIHGGVVIFAAGAQVPASTVEAHEWLLPLVTRTAPPPEPGVDRSEQLLLRRAQLEAEAAAIEAELAATAEPGYESMTIAEMRAELSSRYLPTSGNKTELLERLRADDVQRQTNPDDETPEE